MLVARGLMYSAVYFHRVTRVTEVMLSRAVERAGDALPAPLDLQKRVDAEIWGALDKVGGFSRDMISRLKYRNLLKVCLSRRKDDLEPEQIEKLASIANDLNARRELEDDIAFRAGLEPGYVAIDVPSVKLLLSEPRMTQVDVKIVGDDGKTRWLKEVTPMADALRKRQVSQEAVYVMTLSGNEQRVAEIAKQILF
jgi:HD superfamily phosphohydrolase